MEKTLALIFKTDIQMYTRHENNAMAKYKLAHWLPPRHFSPPSAFFLCTQRENTQMDTNLFQKTIFATNQENQQNSNETFLIMHGNNNNNGDKTNEMERQHEWVGGEKRASHKI